MRRVAQHSCQSKWQTYIQYHSLKGTDIARENRAITTPSHGFRYTYSYIYTLLETKKTIENPWLGVVMALFSRATSVHFREWYRYCMYVCHLDPGLPRLNIHRYLECIYARR